MNYIIKDVDVLNTKLSPFLRVENEFRIRIMIDRLQPSDFKAILSTVNSETFTMLLLYNLGFRNHNNQKKYQLNRYFTITNWKEHIINDEEAPYPLRFIEVNGVSNEEIVKYYSGLIKHQVTPMITYFMTAQTMIRFGPFYLDVVSENEQIIKSLKEQLSGIYETEFDDIEPMTEEDL